MAAVARLGDVDTGHDACPPRPNIEASSNVYANGRAIHRQGDGWAPHGCSSHSPHGAVTASGSSNVFINKKPIARRGDPVSCGGSIGQSSPNVYANS